MIELKTIHPYVDDNGEEHYGLMKLYAADENGCRYKIVNKKTNNLSEEIVTFYPLRLNLVVSNIKCERQPNDKKKTTKKEKIEVKEKAEPIIDVREYPKTIVEAEVESGMSPDDVIVEKETAIEELTEIEDVVEELGTVNKDEEGEQNNEFYKED